MQKKFFFNLAFTSFLMFTHHLKETEAGNCRWYFGAIIYVRKMILNLNQQTHSKTCISQRVVMVLWGQGSRAWKSQFLDRLIRSSGSPRRREESGIPKERWVNSVAQRCSNLCNPMDCSLPGSSVHGICQARGLEWGAMAFSLGAWEDSNAKDHTRYKSTDTGNAGGQN